MFIKLCTFLDFALVWQISEQSMLTNTFSSLLLGNWRIHFGGKRCENQKEGKYLQSQ